ncbi:Lipase GDSL [Macrophomina phaseolina MS6]|uniref:Lipase GDSL n=1 Tax=Macrophomina phaseolina (strain MS6) TaxID=1126212 RepID=K2RQT3_MACPH|nr:Lipase GDSL [Macrophomina phaseolina MS6]
MLSPVISHLVLVLLTLLTHNVASTPSPYKAASPHDLSHRQFGSGNHTAGHWIAAWTSMPQLTEPANLPPAPFNTSSGLVFEDATIRQTIRVTATSSRIRLRISNAFGLTPLPITAVTIAKPVPHNSAASPNTTGAGSPVIDTTTLHTLTFNRGSSPNTTIPNGALALTDAIDLPITAGTDLTVTLYLSTGQTGGAITSHPGSRTTSWLAQGAHASAADLSTAPGATSVAHWYFISTLDAWVHDTPPGTSGTLALVGDSITDGRGSTTNGNDRWPDALLARLQQEQPSSSATDPFLSAIAIANQAAGGNRVLADGLGPNALGRFDRDVLAQPGVKWVAIFEGVNDIGTAGTDAGAQAAVGDALIAAYVQFALRAHAAGLPIFGATITPFSAPGFNVSAQPYSSAERERTRQRVNAWIRESRVFDAVVDFDAAVRDEEDGSILRIEYDSGDYLHLNPEGYKAMADAFPVEALKQFAGGVDEWA